MLPALRSALPGACSGCRVSVTHRYSFAVSASGCTLVRGRRATSSSGAPGRRRRGQTASATGATDDASNEQQRQEKLQQLLGELQALQSLPTVAHGQVISAEANFVRVNITRLGDDDEAADADAERRGSHSTASTSAQKQQLQPPRTQLLCTVRALLKKVGVRVLVGDHVRMSGIDWREGRGVVDSAAPRSSELTDPAIANVDHVLLLFGLTQPPFEPQQVSRFLVSVGATGLPVSLALNKADLLPAAEVEARLRQVASWGHTAHAVSCETGEGLPALAAALAGRTSVVAGPSGAGKSSLINALRLGRHRADAAVGGGGGRAAAAAAGGQLLLPPLPPPALLLQQQQGGLEAADGVGEMPQMRSNSARAASFLPVGEMSRIGRGKHTTRTVSLIELPFGGLLADSPGFSQPSLDRVDSAALGELFPEFERARHLAGGCRFADCLHVAEPGCAINEGDFERYEHYLKFLAEIKLREEQDVRVMQLAKARREGAVKTLSGRGGRVRYEARLDARKHRTGSRRAAKQAAVREEELERDGGGRGRVHEP